MKKKAVIVCPGRGTYNKSELGYIARNHTEKRAVLDGFDDARRDLGQIPLSDLDQAERFSMTLHTSGENASGLIFAASYFDAQDVFEAFDVVAVTGNSMGWYTTLAVAGAVESQHGFNIVNTMGRLMQDASIGGQTLYPFVGDDWRHDPSAREGLLQIIEEINEREDHTLTVSIALGGMLVLAGNAAGLDAFEATVPERKGRFPLRLLNHAAFHSALQEPVARKGQDALGVELFGNCKIPMVDGRGAIWSPHSYDPRSLRDYTLGHQITETYDFTSAIRVAARAFAPDIFVVLGPGDAMGSAVAQSLIAIDWRGIESKGSFQARQKTDPVLLSMGRNTDRATLNGLRAAR